MSKHDILLHSIGIIPMAMLSEGQKIAYYEAMDEYAKRQSIGFMNWLADSGWIEIESEELKKKAWVNCKEQEVLTHGSDWHYTTLINECSKTTSELYELFLQSQNK